MLAASCISTQSDSYHIADFDVNLPCLFRDTLARVVKLSMSTAHTWLFLLNCTVQ